MKKIIFCGILLVIIFFLNDCCAFYVGFGHSGTADAVIKKGQELGVIPSVLQPLNLKATAISPTQINLAWQDNSGNEQGFKIERKAAGGSYIEIAVVGANITSYNNTGLSSVTTYYYRIRAYNAGGVSEYSNEAYTTTLSNPPGIPSLPVGPDSGTLGTIYNYSTSAVDPDGDQVKYGWDWNGDGTADEWSSLGASGWTDTRSHSWTAPGTYTIRVKAEDSYRTPSGWSDPKAVVIVNNPPDAPSAPSGPDSTVTGITYTYSTSAADPEGNQVKYGWDWNGDGTADEWSSLGASGWTDNRSHLWTTPGTYTIRVKAQDYYGEESGWSNSKIVIVELNNPPGMPSTPSGPDSGITSVSYEYSASAIDSDGNQVKYGWDWNGDGTADEWSSLGASGWTDTRSHSWTTPGTYTIRVKAQDYYGAESGWSNAKSMTVKTFVKVDVGSVSSQEMYCVAVGIGRNDGVTRVYGVFADEVIYEFTYSGAWNRTYVGSGSSGVGVMSVTVGNGRNDGVTRVYAASEDGKIYEYTYSSGWNRVELGFGGGAWVQSVVVGNGRNDGVMRVYGTSGTIYEFTYSGGWNSAVVGSPPSQFLWSICVGNGRNDGTPRVYGAWSENYVYEFTYSAGWSRTDVGTGGNYAVTVGNGRNDGTPRVYAGCGNGNVYEFTYLGGIWNIVEIVGGSGRMSSVVIGNGRNDGVTRVYGANADGHIYEFTFK